MELPLGSESRVPYSAATQYPISHKLTAALLAPEGTTTLSKSIPYSFRSEIGRRKSASVQRSAFPARTQRSRVAQRRASPWSPPRNSSAERARMREECPTGLAVDLTRRAVRGAGVGPAIAARGAPARCGRLSQDARAVKSFLMHADHWPTVAVVGAGAVGCYFGGMLARSGVRVTLIGRVRHLEAIARDGLLLDGLRVHERIPVTASTSIGERLRDAHVDPVLREDR